MSEQIGDTWYFVKSTHDQRKRVTAREIEAAQVIGETPCKWILRESDEIARGEAGRREYVAEPGESYRDWAIPKKGDATREGRGFRNSTREFYATEEFAQARIAQLQEEDWMGRNVYWITRRVEMCKDPALLRKIAEMVGYKEDPTP